MKMRLLPAFAGLAICFTLQIFALEKESTPSASTPVATPRGIQQAVSADVRSQIEAVFVKFQDAYNARDAEGIASMMTLDAVEMRSGAGLAIGRQAVVARFLQDFKENLGPMVNTILQMYPVGSDGVCVIADSHAGAWEAHTMTLYVRSGGGWKSKMSYVRGP